MYHAGKNRIPLCNTNGKAHGWNVVVLNAKEWNALKTEQKCSKCVAKIKFLKSGN